METGIFRMSRKRIVKELFAIHAATWLLLVGVSVVPAILAGVLADIRWLIVFFMMVLVVTPMLLAFLFVFHGMKEATAINSVPHSLTFSEDGVLAVVFRNGEDDKDNTSSVLLPYSMLGAPIPRMDSVVVPVEGMQKGFLWIPPSPFASQADFKDAVGMIADRIPLAGKQGPHGSH